MLVSYGFPCGVPKISRLLNFSQLSKLPAIVPDVREEASQLSVEALRIEPPLEDRACLDQASIRQLLCQHPRVAEGVQRVTRVADDQRRLLDAKPLLPVRRRLSQQQPLQHRA